VKLGIKELVELMAQDDKRRKEEHVLKLQMEYGDKWKEEYRREEMDRQQAACDLISEVRNVSNE
jgi:hypothetical protein